MTHASCSLTALCVSIQRLGFLCFTLTVWCQWLKSFSLLFPLILVTIHKISCSPSRCFIKSVHCQPAHFPPSNVPRALRNWDPLSQHKTAKWDAHTPFSNSLRMLHWKLVWVAVLAHIPPRWSQDPWLITEWRGISLPLPSFVSCCPRSLERSIRCPSLLTPGLQACSFTLKLWLDS